MFKRILVPLDGSSLAECVLPHVVAIAGNNGVEVLLLRVLDPLAASTRPLSVDPFEWQVRRAEAETYLRNIAARLQDTGLKTREAVLEGRAAETVIEYAHEHQADLILLSSHGQSGISGWNVSSVVQKIILRAQTSIMIVRAYQCGDARLAGLHYRRLLLPLDGSQRAEIVLPVTVNLARLHQAEIILAHVVRKPEMPRRTPLAQEDIDLANQVSERNRAEAEQYLEDLKSRVDAAVQTRLVVSENVTEPLHRIVEEDQIDLVLLSAHGYTGGTRWPYGSTVISFIAYGETPLLVIQDLAPDRMEPTMAELAARQQGGAR